MFTKTISIEKIKLYQKILLLIENDFIGHPNFKYLIIQKIVLDDFSEMNTEFCMKNLILILRILFVEITYLSKGKMIQRKKKKNNKKSKKKKDQDMGNEKEKEGGNEKGGGKEGEREKGKGKGKGEERVDKEREKEREKEKDIPNENKSKNLDELFLIIFPTISQILKLKQIIEQMAIRNLQSFFLKVKDKTKNQQILIYNIKIKKALVEFQNYVKLHKTKYPKSICEYNFSEGLESQIRKINQRLAQFRIDQQRELYVEKMSISELYLEKDALKFEIYQLKNAFHDYYNEKMSSHEKKIIKPLLNYYFEITAEIKIKKLQFNFKQINIDFFNQFINSLFEQKPYQRRFDFEINLLLYQRIQAKKLFLKTFHKLFF
ncbi:hypothetical protein M0812_04499 [Anaeramoeba flamelloides]|uniref:Uncharacterized protein n=1 Tax=Anaeramoeba flamelloides TaxID=1746091 RepID=A0AAV8AK78_9EUKA|nr:hypothetical protein M0812_04499 [Anaeramoeba flamelloides]